MKLIRFGTINKEKPGVLLPNGIKLDVSAFVSDTMRIFLEIME